MEAVYAVKLAWPQIMADMKERGLPYSKQAHLIGVPWSTYQFWMEGEGEPRHSQGVAILKLHTAICGAELTSHRLTEGAEKV